MLTILKIGKCCLLVISHGKTLWNREGSRVIQGNLLIIPIEQSLLYVEPIYLEAEQNSVPTLVRVVVAYQDRIVMAPTLDDALTAAFQPTKPTVPAIVPYSKETFRNRVSTLMYCNDNKDLSATMNAKKPGFLWAPILMHMNIVSLVIVWLMPKYLT